MWQMKEGDRETREVLKKKVVEDLEIGEGRLINMIMSRTLLQGTLMEGGLIIGNKATKKIKENHINQRLLERIPIPKFDGISEEIKPRDWIGKGYVKALKPATLEEAIQQAEAYSEVAKRICFNCKEKRSKGHKCKTPEKIYMIEILNEEHPQVVESDQEQLVGVEEEIIDIEDQEQQETPKVSLVAILEVTQYQTMRVRSKVKGRTMVALVDSSSTHNFIDSKLVSSTKMKVE
eukprot:Gb_26001 [translate_table: standard]